jgi:hypothetical protein
VARYEHLVDYRYRTRSALASRASDFLYYGRVHTCSVGHRGHSVYCMADPAHEKVTAFSIFVPLSWESGAHGSA